MNTILKERRMLDRLAMAIAWALPRRLVMWCAYRIGAVATTGEWGHVDPGSLTFFEAIHRFGG